MGALVPRRLTRAASRTTPRLILAAYLWHPMPWMARTAAVNPETPRWAKRRAYHRELLLDIALSDQDTDSGFLDKHSRDESLTPSLLDLIARHPNTSTEVLLRVAAHENVSPAVLNEIVCHRNTPLELAEDILVRAQTHYRVSHKDAISLYLYSLRRNDLSASAWSWLAHNCQHPFVLRKVARHPNTPNADAVLAALSSGTLLDKG